MLLPKWLYSIVQLLSHSVPDSPADLPEVDVDKLAVFPTTFTAFSWRLDIRRNVVPTIDMWIDSRLRRDLGGQKGQDPVWRRLRSFGKWSLGWLVVLWRQ